MKKIILLYISVMLLTGNLFSASPSLGQNKKKNSAKNAGLIIKQQNKGI
jgi:hypothetical protein